MEHFAADRPEQYIEHLIHLDTQKAPHGIDLTVDAVFSVDSAGSLDFGGSEFQPADRSELPPQSRSEDDDYGWWELDEGTYLVRYNETIDPGEGLAVIRPLDRLASTGAFHPSMCVSADDNGPLEIALRVPEVGVNIKENARVSRAVVYE